MHMLNTDRIVVIYEDEIMGEAGRADAVPEKLGLMMVGLCESDGEEVE